MRMRNLEDCRAEVFRRSEQRIHRRQQQRRRILTCCIPLCLCLAVGSVTLFPAWLSGNKSAHLCESLNESEHTASSTLPIYSHCAYMEITLPEESTGRKIIDRDTIRQVDALIQAAYSPLSGNNETAESGVFPPSVPENGVLSYYTLTVFAQDGSPTVFTLTDTTITQQKTGQTVALTPEVFAEFATLLSLPEETTCEQP